MEQGYTDGLIWIRGTLANGGSHIWQGPYSSEPLARESARGLFLAYDIDLTPIPKADRKTHEDRVNCFCLLEWGTRVWRSYAPTHGRWVLLVQNSLGEWGYQNPNPLESAEEEAHRINADNTPDNDECFGPFAEDFCPDVTAVPGVPVISVTCEYTPGYMPPPNPDGHQVYYVSGYSTYNAYISGQPGANARTIAYTKRTNRDYGTTVVKDIRFSEGSGEEINQIYVPAFAVISDDFQPNENGEMLNVTIGAVYGSSLTPILDYGPNGPYAGGVPFYNFSQIKDGNTVYLGTHCNIQDTPPPPVAKKKEPPEDKAKTRYTWDGNCLTIYTDLLPASVFTVCAPSLSHSKIGDVGITTEGVKPPDILEGIYGNGKLNITVSLAGVSIDFGTDGTGLPPFSLLEAIKEGTLQFQPDVPQGL